MTLAHHPALLALPMRPGRRRMLELLIAASPRGASLADLSEAFYADGAKPSSAKGAMACQVQRLRSQLKHIDFSLLTIRSAGNAAGVYVLAEDAETAPTPVAQPSPGPTPAERLGIRSTSRMIAGSPVSVPRSAFLDGDAR